MLQLYNLNKNKIDGLKKYKDYCIESALNGDKVLSFLYPASLSKNIKEEGYIQNKYDEFVIKEIQDQDNWKVIKAVLNVEDLEGKEWEHFDTTEKNIEECLTLAVVGTGWTIGICNVKKRRTVRKTNCSTWDIIQEAKKIYRVEYKFDTLKKKINIYEKLGSDKGVYFKESLNLRKLEHQSDSYEFYTRIIAKGKDDLKVTVENYQYSKKKKTLIWVDERYSKLESLKEDATAKLEDLSKPRKAYSADIIDLANINEEYKDILGYSIGDTITLLSKEKGIKEKQRIVKILEYPEEPERNTCEIANTTLKFEDIQQEYDETVDIVNNITTDDGTIKGSTIDGIETEQIKDFKANVIKVVDFSAVNARIQNLYTEKADIGSLNAVNARIGTVESTKANITDLNAINANIINLKANKADIEEVNATNIKVKVIEGKTANIENVLAGNLTSTNIQTGGLTGDNLNMNTVFIKDANIIDMSASKINTGTINTNLVTVQGSSGNLLIKDNTIQIRDNIRTRVQIGKDASNDYNMYIWDSTGKLMFDATGLKAEGIKEKIIRDDMVSDNANISGFKLDISSVVTAVNNGVTNLKSSKILFDSEGQTLDIAFNNLKSQVSKNKNLTESHTTKIDVQQGQIGTLIQDTTIVKDTTTKLKDSYNRTVSKVDGLSSTIGLHTSQINTITGKVEGVNTKVNSVERDLNGTKSVVSSHTNIINGLNTTLSNQGTEIIQLKNKIELKASKEEVKTTVNYELENLKIGIRNYILNSGFINALENWGTYKSDIKIEKDDTLKCNIVKVVNKTGEKGGLYQFISKTIESNKYILSAYVKGTKGKKAYIAFESAKINNFIFTGEWQKICVYINEEQFKKWDKAIVIYSTDPTQTFYCSKLLLTVGNKLLDWVPAPEDIQINTDKKFDEVTSKITPASIVNTVKSSTSNGKYIFAQTAVVEQMVNEVKYDFKQSGGFNLLRNGNCKNGTKYWKANGSYIKTVHLENQSIGSINAFESKFAGGIYGEDIQLKNNTHYVYEFWIKAQENIKGVNFYPANFWCTHNKGSVKEQAFTLIDGRQEVKINEWCKVYIHFKTASTREIWFRPYVYFPKGSSIFYVTELSLSESITERKWTPNPTETYEGITKIDGEGISIFHSENGTTTKMSSKGFYILNSKGESVGSLAHEAGLSILNADKVYATNVVSVYEGSNTIYVNPGVKNEGDGTQSKPYKTLNQCLNDRFYRGRATYLKSNVTIQIQGSGDLIDTSLDIIGFLGKGILTLNFAPTLILKTNTVINVNSNSTSIIMNGGRSGPRGNDGCRIINGQSNPCILIANCTYVDIERFRFSSSVISDAAIRVHASALKTLSNDYGNGFNNCVNATDNAKCFSFNESGSPRQNCYYVDGGSFYCIGAAGETTYIPGGAFTENVGLKRTHGNLNVSQSVQPSVSGTSGAVKTETWNMSSQSYNQNGYWNEGRDVMQGNWGYGNNVGYMIPPASCRSSISGSSIKNIQIYIRRKSGGGISGNVALYLKGSNQNSLGSGFNNYNQDYGYIGSLAWGQEAWFSIPNSVAEHLKNGTINSLCLYTNDGSNYFRSDGECTKIKITYQR